MTPHSYQRALSLAQELVSTLTELQTKNNSNLHVPPSPTRPTAPTTQKSVREQVVNKAIVEMHKSLQNSEYHLSLIELSRRVGMNTTSFSKAFKDIHKQSPMSYFKRMRLDYAAKLLVERELSISVIAVECSFSSAAFSTAFRQAFGISPSEFRKKAKGKG